MKKGLRTVVAAFFLVLMLGGSSLAAIDGLVYYNVTGYNLTTHNLQYTFGITPDGGTLGGSFTVDALNFTTENGESTYTKFLSNGGANGLVWDDTASATFGANTIQTNGTYASVFEFAGVAYFSENFSIRHDDGFVLWVYSINDIYDYSHPTSPEVANMTLATYGLAPGWYGFNLTYAAWNGFPEVLQIQSGITVPEPTTLLLLGLGLIGMAGVRRFKK